jgi:hypothetical protein
LVRPPGRWAADESNEAEDPFEQPPPVSGTYGEPFPTSADDDGSSDSGPIEPQEPPLLPDDRWVSPAAHDRRQWLMIGAGAVIGVVMSVILLGLWASRSGDVSPDPSRSQVAERPSPQPVARPNDGDAAMPAEQVAQPASDQNDADGPKPVPSEDATQETTAPELVDPGIPERPAELMPLPKEAAVADGPPSPPDGVPDDEPSTEDKPDTSALTRALQAFAPFIQDEPYSPAEPADAQDEAGPMMDLPEWDGQRNGQVSIPRPEPREVDVAGRLQDTVPALELPGMPLIAFTHFVTGLSTIPISLDPDALALLRIRPDRPVTVKATDTDVSGILTAALQPLGLGYVPVNGQLLVTRVVPTGGPLRSVRHPVGDLVGSSSEQLEQLSDWITAMVEPDSWDSQGGPGGLQAELPDLVIQHQDTVLLHALLFCERLRVARGLPTKTNLDPALARLELRFKRAQPLLEKSVRIRYAEPALLLLILQRVTRETGLQILVDWQALGQMGWTPAAETLLLADGMPLGEAMTEMLRPMDLTYRVVDATTVQITSPTADKGQWDVEFHPVGDLLDESPDAKGLLERLADAAQQSRLGESDGVFHYDAPSRHLIAALSQPDQRWLADLLARWRSERP